MPTVAGAILIADDSQDDVDLLTRDLRRMSLRYPIHSVPNGESVVSYLQGQGVFGERDKYPAPILLVMDLRMEPMDGFAVLRWLKENPRYKTFPILIHTGLSDRARLAEAYRLGATTFLTKPFSRSALAQTFQALNLD